MRQIILKDSRSFELIPDVQTNSTASVATKVSTALKGRQLEIVIWEFGDEEWR